MPRAAARFTQADVRRAIRGAAAAGLPVGRVEILPDGRIVVVAVPDPAGAGTTDADVDAATALDEWLAKDQARARTSQGHQ